MIYVASQGTGGGLPEYGTFTYVFIQFIGREWSPSEHRIN